MAMDKKELISLFILAFIDQSSQRYMTCLSDYYDNEQGFSRCVLWDCIKGANRVSFQHVISTVITERHVYCLKDPSCTTAFQDISLFELSGSEAQAFIRSCDEFEDYYLFDDSFEWTCVVTHEWLENDRRYCLMVDNRIAT